MAAKRIKAAVLLGLLVVAATGFTVGCGTQAAMSDTESASVSVAAGTWVTAEPVTTEEATPTESEQTSETTTTTDAEATAEPAATEAAPTTETAAAESTPTNTTTEQDQLGQPRRSDARSTGTLASRLCWPGAHI
jgi:uncharacterized membrane protein